MPKMKTNRGLRKRFRVTKNGKLSRSKAFSQHLMSHKSGKRRRRLRRGSIVCKADARKILRMLGRA